MTLVEDWKQILRKAWSVRLAILAAGFAALEVVLPILAPSMPPGYFAILSAISASGTVLVRVLDQRIGQ